MSKISNKNSNNTKNNNTKGVNISTTDNGIYSTTSSDVITSTYTGLNNISITPGGTSYTSYTSGDINISTTNVYNIDGIEVKFDRSLTFEEISLIVGIDINGTKYYHSMIKNGVSLTGDLKEKIEPIIKVLERKEKLSSILKNKED
tara:strand:- start:257 stop:694 length:438 start_codon:yes stop_codon:yes gene_type:complete